MSKRTRQNKKRQQRRLAKLLWDRGDIYIGYKWSHGADPVDLERTGKIFRKFYLSESQESAYKALEKSRKDRRLVDDVGYREDYFIYEKGLQKITKPEDFPDIPADRYALGNGDNS